MKQSNLPDIFKALSNEQRLKIFKMIYKGHLALKSQKEPKKSKGCCEGMKKAFTFACNCMDISRSTISHHFKELEAAGLITCERDGQATICKVNEEAVNAVKDFLE